MTLLGCLETSGSDYPVNTARYPSTDLFLYTGCPGGNVPDFGRMFLKLKYTDITKNTYIRS